MARSFKPLIDRIMKRVSPCPFTGCWLFIGHLDTKGYAAITNEPGSKNRLVRVHRETYKHFIGPIPEGLELDHTCHTNDLNCKGGASCPHRSCVNPAHLEPVTHEVNLARGREPDWRPSLGLAAERKRNLTHCKHGHEFTPENTKIRTKGGRLCLACKSEDQKRRKPWRGQHRVRPRKARP
jgi:hypothetical protein